jgi:ABC-type transport system involved in multi-copper enzyme maturation permease subunit
MLDRKVVWIYAAASVVGVLVLLVARQFEVQFQAEGMDMQDMGPMLTSPLLFLYHKFTYYLVFLSVMVTAGLLPKMLIKGRADYFLSKPLLRKTLLLNKLFAVWVVYGAMIVLVMLVEAAVGGVAFSIFDAGVVYIVLANLLALFVWLSITFFAGIISGSGPTSILMAFAVWVVQQILAFHKGISQLIDTPLLSEAVTAAYYIWPKTIAISDQSLNYVTGGSFDWMPLYSSLIFALGLVYVTVFIFNRRDY